MLRKGLRHVGPSPTSRAAALTSGRSRLEFSGYVLVMDRDFEHAIRRNAGLALILGIVSTAVVGLLLYAASQHLPTDAPGIHALYDVTLDVFWSLNIW
jgi:hypothetical protein